MKFNLIAIYRRIYGLPSGDERWHGKLSEAVLPFVKQLSD
jgi:hypothetical protein